MTLKTFMAQTEAPIVFVVDDDSSVRDGLEDLLASVGLRVQSFASTQEFLRANRPDVPTCLVLDIRMPGMSGLDFQREMTSLNVQIPIVFITAHGDIPMTVRAMKDGAVEFLTKPFREQDLLDAIQAGLDQDRLRREETVTLTKLQGCYGELTAGERQVMALVISGRLNKQIAADLRVSEITVKVRRRHVMQKMHVKSLAELVRIAAKLGISPSREA